MVAYAYRYVPFYRQTMDEMHLKPSDIRTAADLARLPIIERSTLRQNPDRFISSQVSKETAFKVTTGGTSGIPCLVYHDGRSLFQNIAHGERERSIMVELVGKRWGYREAVIGSPTNTTGKVHLYTRKYGYFPKKINIERRYLSMSDPVEQNIRILNDFRPDIIQSFGSYLQILFPYLLESGLPFHQPKLISFSSDGLSDSVRRLVQDQFHIPVLGTYEAGEAFKIGFECLEHRGYHVNEDLYPVRIVDEQGNELPPGESGDVVISNLVNRATVLLNYRLGDIATLYEQCCPCGRSLPLLSFVQGRKDDWITLGSGVKLHPSMIRTNFRHFDQIWQFQVMQRSLWHLDVSIVAAENCDHKQIGDRLKKMLAQVCGDDVRVDIQFVQYIERTAGGKLRAVISMVEAGQSCAGR